MKSRYIRYVKQKVPKQRKTIRMPGAGQGDRTKDDSGIWIRCWNCGFPINTTTTNLNTDADGVQCVDFPYEEPTKTRRGTTDYTTATLDSLDMVGVALQTGPDGNPITGYYTPRKVDIVSGCPFCGTNHL